MNLIELYNDSGVRSISKFCQRAKELEISELCNGYADLLRIAPRRSDNDKSYFHERTGATSSRKESNRREEHLALALFNASRADVLFSLPDGRDIGFIDYQTPFKVKQSDPGIGKVDLLGVINETVPAVIELKIEGLKNTMADTPLRALLEGFAYCALFEANGEAIAAEAAKKLNQTLSVATPSLIILAPEEYWRRYLRHSHAGDWLPELNRIMEGLVKELGLESHLVAIRGLDFEMGRIGNPARLVGSCELISVHEIS